jgi:hypothetical protein
MQPLFEGGFEPWYSSRPLLYCANWTQYVRPDGSSYYVRPTLRVTTDVDLQDAKNLEHVTAYLARERLEAPAGMEVWLRVDATKDDLALCITWVDHKKRAISPLSNNADTCGKMGNTMDGGYRRWSTAKTNTNCEI